MNDISTIIYLIAGLVVVLLVISVFLAFQMKAMNIQMQTLSYKLYFELTRKADLIPLFLDKLKSHSLNMNIASLVDLRQQTMQLTDLCTKKKDLEAALWDQFAELWTSAKSKDTVKNDHRLLALESDLDEADSRVKALLLTYNNYVKKYNALVGNFLLKPVALLAKSKKAELF